MPYRIIAFLLVAAVAVEGHANTANFDALVANTMYTSGTGFANGGLDFDVLYGESPLTVAAASNEINPSFSGKFLQFTSNDFLNVNLPTGASQINFDFILEYPSVGFDVNDAFVTYDQIPITINGVTLTQVLGSKTNPWGSIKATGNINTFIVDGTEFSVDNLSVTALPGVAGDYNKNNVVDAADYVVWRKTLNTPSGYNSWRSNFGKTGTGAGSGNGLAALAVPEPTVLGMIWLCIPWFMAIRHNGLNTP
ncbi:MAG TPA: hypothetical protein VFW73_07370 [Lacipirellulaceae bacterium]|nr:hypothetical protein [Lacipirellulaceae bacterium]